MSVFGPWCVLLAFMKCPPSDKQKEPVSDVAPLQHQRRLYSYAARKRSEQTDSWRVCRHLQ